MLPRAMGTSEKYQLGPILRPSGDTRSKSQKGHYDGNIAAIRNKMFGSEDENTVDGRSTASIIELVVSDGKAHGKGQGG